MPRPALLFFFTALLSVILARPPAPAAQDWPRFRGPNGSGVAEEERELPARLEPGQGAAWSADLPPGISSPVVAGGRLYLTGLREKTLLTLALDPASGKVLWERPAPAERLEEVHSTSHPAASTPAADGEQVVAFFGSWGLLSYDRDGKELWRLPLAPLNNPFGASSSPILAGELVLLNCDQDRGSFLMAVEKRTGKVRYRVERPEFPRGYSTPILWEHGGVTGVLVAGTLKLKAYRVEDGRELWSVPGLARIVNPTPVTGQGLLFVASFSPGGDTGERITMPPFERYASDHDKDKNGLLTAEEVTEEAMKNRFLQIDGDKDGSITPEEWQTMAAIFDAARNAILAFRPQSPGQQGVELAWKHERAIPYVPSPLYYQGAIYLLKDGGIFSSLDAATGKVLKQGRLPGGGSYYSSPVAGAGKIYCASLNGEVSVVSAGPTWEVLSSFDFKERCAATPAIAAGRVYLRTERRLHAFAAGGAAAAPGGGGGR